MLPPPTVHSNSCFSLRAEIHSTSPRSGQRMLSCRSLATLLEESLCLKEQTQSQSSLRRRAASLPGPAESVARIFRSWGQEGLCVPDLWERPLGSFIWKVLGAARLWRTISRLPGSQTAAKLPEAWGLRLILREFLMRVPGVFCFFDFCFLFLLCLFVYWQQTPLGLGSTNIWKSPTKRLLRGSEMKQLEERTHLVF